ncbi:MAG TPA: hydroxyacylglutathione hydrolase [Alphaproteobacteria bacterium]|jgi:hydroxyacylglutathione hydrolase|nr:hydroxyacylglutathione hydrolase [Alphaproteobacteria bacterium]
MSALNVELIPAFQDNYIYLLRTPGSDDVGIVDAGDAVPALAQLDRHGLTLTHIFNTHHHPDHIGGNDALKARFPNAKLVGPASETVRIPGMDVKLKDGDTYGFGTIHFETLEVPGHTTGHIALFSQDGNALFCGDTLFAMGCGRMFEGTAPQMWHSLSRLKQLPPETRVYCAHEYTQGNARFTLTVDPTNKAAVARVDEVNRLRAEGKPTVPSTIGLENKTNPFLRADDPTVAENVGLAGADPVAVFAEVRRRKDNF